MLMAAGEVVWVGVEPLGERDGRIALYLTDRLPRLRSHVATGRGEDIVAYLRSHGASFFGAIHEGTGGGFPAETVDALWELVWQGLVTNDTLHPLRAFLRAADAGIPRRLRGGRTDVPARSRRLVPPKAEGRWSLVDAAGAKPPTVTEWGAATAGQLLTRFGVVTREAVSAEAVAGGFSPVYQVLKAMEEAGRVRRGYFVAGLGAAQFAMPAAVDLLRAMRDAPETSHTVALAATDPANPYGAVLKWSRLPDEAGAGGPTRSAGARVVLVDGLLAAYLRRGERELLLFAPDAEPRRSQVIREVARMLRHLAVAREPGQRGMLVAEINGEDGAAHPAAPLFVQEGFALTALGLQLRPDRGIGIAELPSGGNPMTEQPRADEKLVDNPDQDETRDTEQDRREDTAD